MVKEMEKGCLLIKIKIYIQDNGKMEKKMATALMFTLILKAE